jgi:mRNA interferase RelE/StbE
MAGRRPAIPPNVAEVIRHLPPTVKRAVRSAIRAIGANRAVGEPLQGELEGLWKYPVRRFRVVYEMDRATKTVMVIAVGQRRSIYEEVAELLRQQK